MTESTEQKLKDIYIKTLQLIKTKNWEQAHALVQDINTREAALIHAYLHRIEGDLSNADYWYQKADTQRPDYSIEKEWQHLMEKFEY